MYPVYYDVLSLERCLGICGPKDAPLVSHEVGATFTKNTIILVADKGAACKS